MDDVTVDLGPLPLFDAQVVRAALGAVIAVGYWFDAEQYAAAVTVKSRLNVQIAKAEKTSQYVEPA